MEPEGGAQAARDLQEYYFGINDPLGADPAGFTPVVMTAFDAWASGDGEGKRGERRRVEARAAIVRGQTLFNTRPIAIVDVSGLNDDLHLAGPSPEPAPPATTLRTRGITRCPRRCGSARPSQIRWAGST